MKVMHVGKFQPLNLPDKNTIDADLDNDIQIVLAVRDTPVDEENPLTLLQRMDILRAVYPDKVNVVIIPVPDVDAVEGMWEYGKTVAIPPKVQEMIEEIREGVAHPEIPREE